MYIDKKKSLVKRESTNAVDDATTTVVTSSTVSGKEIHENKGPGSDWNQLKKYGDRKVW